jgi:uncharacterized DUF497 family protein
MMKASVSKTVTMTFEWDDEKDAANLAKHGISFLVAQEAFFDPRRIISRDTAHSDDETRYYCFGKIAGNVVTVRFTLRKSKIRIIGAGYWRKGRKAYEKASKIH